MLLLPAVGPRLPSKEFPPSPSVPLVAPALGRHGIADSLLYEDHRSITRTTVAALWSAAERAFALPRIESPGEKDGLGIFVERTLLDALLPFNATLSLALAFLTASINELTRTNKIEDLVTYLVGPPEEDDAAKPVTLPWEWDRVGHDTATGLAKDAGSQTLTRVLEIRTKASVGGGAPYCELLKHAHKNACKTYHDARALPGARRLGACYTAAKAIVASPTFYCVRSLTYWLSDIAVDGVAWVRGQLSTPKLKANVGLKAVKYTLSGMFCLAFGTLVPFAYPHPYVFLGVEQLAANLLAETCVGYLGSIEPS